MLKGLLSTPVKLGVLKCGSGLEHQNVKLLKCLGPSELYLIVPRVLCFACIFISVLSPETPDLLIFNNVIHYEDRSIFSGLFLECKLEFCKFLHILLKLCNQLLLSQCHLSYISFMFLLISTWKLFYLCVLLKWLVITLFVLYWQETAFENKFLSI